MRRLLKVNKFIDFNRNSILSNYHCRLFQTDYINDLATNLATGLAADLANGQAASAQCSIQGTAQSAAPEVLARGKKTFRTLCAPCHRADGGGLVGPNLTDNYWIHGSSYADSVKIIWDGVPAKGMITWKTVLKPEDIQAVASYIYTLRGAKLLKPGKLPENQLPAKPAGASQFE